MRSSSQISVIMVDWIIIDEFDGISLWNSKSNVTGRGHWQCTSKITKATTKITHHNASASTIWLAGDQHLFISNSSHFTISARFFSQTKQAFCVRGLIQRSSRSKGSSQRSNTVSEIPYRLLGALASPDQDDHLRYRGKMTTSKQQRTLRDEIII